MKYEQVRDLISDQFRRLTGVKKETFTKMIDILKEADHKKKVQRRSNLKLSTFSSKNSKVGFL